VKRILNAKPKEPDEDLNRVGNQVKPMGERNLKKINLAEFSKEGYRPKKGHFCQ
jgi:hypothetical protein